MPRDIDRPVVSAPGVRQRAQHRGLDQFRFWCEALGLIELRGRFGALTPLGALETGLGRAYERRFRRIAGGRGLRKTSERAGLRKRLFFAAKRWACGPRGRCWAPSSTRATRTTSPRRSRCSITSPSSCSAAIAERSGCGSASTSGSECVSATGTFASRCVSRAPSRFAEDLAGMPLHKLAPGFRPVALRRS